MACTAHAQECSTCHFCYPGSSCEGGQLKKLYFQNFCQFPKVRIIPNHCIRTQRFQLGGLFHGSNADHLFGSRALGGFNAGTGIFKNYTGFRCNAKALGSFQVQIRRRLAGQGAVVVNHFVQIKPAVQPQRIKKETDIVPAGCCGNRAGNVVLHQKSPKTPSNHPPACNPGSGGRGRGKSFPRLPLPRLLPVA